MLKFPFQPYWQEHTYNILTIYAIVTSWKRFIWIVIDILLYI